jgi:hypothetical protein
MTPRKLLKCALNGTKGKMNGSELEFSQDTPPLMTSLIPTDTNGKLVLATLITMEATLRVTYSTIPEGNLFMFEGGIACTTFYSCIFLFLEYLHQFKRFWLHFFFSGLPLSPNFSQAFDPKSECILGAKSTKFSSSPPLSSLEAL